MSLLTRLESSVIVLRGGDDVDELEPSEACWRCGSAACLLDDGQGLCCECLDTIEADEAEALGVVGVGR